MSVPHNRSHDASPVLDLCRHFLISIFPRRLSVDGRRPRTHCPLFKHGSSILLGWLRLGGAPLGGRVASRSVSALIGHVTGSVLAHRFVVKVVVVVVVVVVVLVVVDIEGEGNPQVMEEDE